MEAYPNPSHGDILITTDQAKSLKTSDINDKIYKLEVIDQYGSIKREFSYTSGVTTIKINLNNLLSGIYIIHAFNGKGWSNKKIIISH